MKYINLWSRPSMSLWMACALLVLLHACSKRDNNTAPPTGETSEAVSPPEDKGPLLYVWVDKLNIREAPDSKAAVVAVAGEGEELKFSGEKSDSIETIVLRGVAYAEPWFRVVTQDKQEGWVFGGAVKTGEEAKGNAVLTAEKFDFPYFGSYDLSSWTKSGTRTESGESDITTTTYKKEDKVLEISMSDMGEFYYGRTYKLMDANGKVLKMRTFSFTADADFRELTETVKDYSSQPPKQYIRTQKLQQHFYQLNARPEMVNGPWKESTLEAGAGAMGAPQQGEMQSFEFAACTKLIEADPGCSCAFRTEKNSRGPVVFFSDMGEMACIKLNDQMQNLEAEKVDYPAELKKQSQSKYWITLQKQGPLLMFGKPAAVSDYDRMVAHLVDVLLVMEKMPAEIPIQNNSEGMAIREIRDMANDALAKAKALKQKGDSTPSRKMLYGNAQYEVTLLVKALTHHEGEANQYEGYMELKAKDGKVLDSKKVYGDCGC